MSNNIYQCDKCERTFSSSQAINGHKRSHTTTKSTPHYTRCCCILTRKEMPPHNLVKYQESLNKCEQCSGYTSNKSFCSSSCASTFNNTARGDRSEETKNKIRDGVRRSSTSKPKYTSIFYACCQICNTSFYKTFSNSQKTCSNDCYKSLASKQMTAKLKDPEFRKKYKGRGGPSYMERTFREWLLSKEVPESHNGFMTELHFKNPETNKHGWADFVFPRLKLIIELDGNHHKGREHLDEIRDQHLQSRGWSVVRVTHQEYLKQTRITEISNLLGV